MSLIIDNNKAASLNMMGRYSESIVLLEKCLRIREKDYFYKNLGDAYFSVSIYDKAIYNYEKTLTINESFDEANYNLAVVLYIQQNYYHAKQAITKAL
jgi:tetratricopeptide (TPR) repeat protein